MFVLSPAGARRNRPAGKRSLAATLSAVMSKIENFASCRVFCYGEACIPHNLVGNFAKGEGEAYGVGFETARGDDPHRHQPSGLRRIDAAELRQRGHGLAGR